MYIINHRLAPVVAASGLLMGVLLAASGITTRAYAADNLDQMRLIQSGVNDAIYSVKSGKGEVRVSYWQKDQSVGEVEAEKSFKVAFDGDRYRYECTTMYLKSTPAPGGDRQVKHRIPAGARFTEVAACDGKRMTRLGKAPKTATVSSVMSGGAQTLDDLFKRALPVMMDRGVVSIPDPGRFESGKGTEETSLTQISREVVNGDECIVVETATKVRSAIGTGNDLVDINWVDPQKDYSIVKSRLYEERSGVRVLASETNIELKEYDGGVWAPSKCVVESYRQNAKGEPQLYSRKAVTYGPQFEVNCKVSADDLSLKLGAGTEVTDELLDIVYTIQ